MERAELGRNRKRQWSPWRLNRKQEIVLLLVLGVIGFILEIFNVFAGGFWILLILFPVLLWAAADYGRDNRYFKAKMLAYLRAVLAFDDGVIVGLIVVLFVWKPF